jgi:hypothetical protein
MKGQHPYEHDTFVLAPTMGELTFLARFAACGIDLAELFFGPDRMNFTMLEEIGGNLCEEVSMSRR